MTHEEFEREGYLRTPSNTDGISGYWVELPRESVVPWLEPLNSFLAGVNDARPSFH
jgi:hypothetical protein